jgi:hypothetical protein
LQLETTDEISEALAAKEQCNSALSYFGDEIKTKSYHDQEICNHALKTKRKSHCYQSIHRKHTCWDIDVVLVQHIQERGMVKGNLQQPDSSKDIKHKCRPIFPNVAHRPAYWFQLEYDAIFI